MKAVIRFSLIFFCLMAFYSESSSQVTYTSGEVALLPGGYSVQVPLNNNSDIGLNNPAFLSRLDGMHFGISYQFSSIIERAYFSDININGRSVTNPVSFQGESYLEGLPYSASITYQRRNLHFAVSMAQKYNLRYESPMVLASVGLPGETAQISRFGEIYDYSAHVSYLINNLPGGNSLSLGSRVSLGRLKYAFNSHYGKVDENFETAFYSFGYALGAEYRFSIGNGDLALGLGYEKGEKYSADIYRMPAVKKIGSSAGVTNPSISYHNIDVITPDALTFDASLEYTDFQFAARASEVFWENASSTYKNNLGLGASVSYKGIKSLSFYLGAFTNNRAYSNNLQSELNDYKAFYLTIGEDTIVGNYTFRFSLSDSHMFSSETMKKSIGRISVEYKF